MRQEIVTLGFDKAINAIKDQKTVYLRRGVWDNYTEVPVESAIGSINNSGYGADVFYDYADGRYYVSIPSSGDMW